MRSWLIILIGLAASWHNTDLASDNGLYNLVMPLLFFLFIIALVIKIAAKIGPDGGGSRSGVDVGPGGFSSGSDSGGGGDC